MDSISLSLPGLDRISTGTRIFPRSRRTLAASVEWILSTFRELLRQISEAAQGCLQSCVPRQGAVEPNVVRVFAAGGENGAGRDDDAFRQGQFVEG